MRLLPSRRTLGVGAMALGASSAALLGAGGTAGASLPAGYSTGLIMVGSNTTEDVMGAVAADYNSSQTVSYVSNIQANPSSPQTARTDSHCNSGTNQTYASAPVPPGDILAPNGSTAGRTALANSVTAGNSCVGVARSSSAPNTSTDPAGTHSFAFGVDGVSWSASATGNAPTNLTLAQLQGVYNCTYTNWNQVGGKAGAIVRYYPQAGSGTRNFFTTSVLGFDPTVLGGTNKCTTAPTLIEENEATSVTTADVPNAITPYAGSKWIAQGNGVSPEGDLRNGFAVNSINGNGSPVSGTGPYSPNTAIVKQSNVGSTTVLGIRDVYNFVNTNSTDYNAALAFVGLSSPLCTGAEATNLSTYGFVAPASGTTTCIQTS